MNAVYHRSYEEREPIEVQITPEEVTILSFPGPDRTVSMDDLRAGRGVARRYRNRRIGEFLKELELSEGRGTGIPKILESMRANGSPEPQFETDEHRPSFLVRLPLRLAPKVEPTVSNSASTSTGATLGAEKVVPKVEPKVVGRLTASTVSTILTACLEAKRPSELHQILGVKDRMVLLYGYLTPLIEQKWLTRTQPLSPNSPTQRYAVTDAGKVWLAAHAKSAR